MLLAGLGFLVGLFAFLVALTRNGAGLGMSSMSLAICGATFCAALTLAGGPKGLAKTIQDRMAKANPPNQGDKDNNAEKPSEQPKDSGGRDRPGPAEKKDTSKDRNDPPTDKPPAPLDVPENPDLARLVRRLRSENATDRIQAANELASLGEAARPAARALCEAATDDQVRQAAIEALEKIQPALAKPITTLLVDSQAHNCIAAAEKLAAMGDSASPAIPVLIWHAKNAPIRFPYRENLPLDIQALTKIGPTDPETVRAIIDHVQSPVTRKANLVRDQEERVVALKALGALSRNQGSLRREIVVCLEKALTECERENNPENYYHIDLCLATIRSIAEFGSDAKQAIPLLKRLKLDKDMQVRQAAASALEQIEK
jgi:HEAT repeat protein